VVTRWEAATPHRRTQQRYFFFFFAAFFFAIGGHHLLPSGSRSIARVARASLTSSSSWPPSSSPC